jgi:hypothetical protein
LLPKTVISYLSSVYCSNSAPTIAFQTFISTFDEASIPSLDAGTDTCTSNILGTSTAISNYFTPTGNAVSWLETHLQTGYGSLPMQSATSKAAVASAVNTGSANVAQPSTNAGAVISVELGVTATTVVGVITLMLGL